MPTTGQSNPGSPRDRTTDSALALPTVGRFLTIAARSLMLRCPHCGGGWVLRGLNTVNDRCSKCTFRFCRSDENYFSGSMFFGILIGEGVAVLIILAAVLLTWPDVPWTLLQYGAPVVLLAAMFAVFPLSRAVWLGVDVLLRPVHPGELLAPAVPPT